VTEGGHRESFVAGPQRLERWDAFDGAQFEDGRNAVAALRACPTRRPRPAIRAFHGAPEVSCGNNNASRQQLIDRSSAYSDGCEEYEQLRIWTVHQPMGLRSSGRRDHPKSPAG
jgi:hypothetical protein